MSDDLLNLIQSLDLDWDRHLRIGVTADADWFVQVIEINDVERVIAQTDNESLTTALRNLIGMLQDENYRKDADSQEELDWMDDRDYNPESNS